MLSPRRTAFIIVCLYLLLVTSAAPIYVVNRLQVTFLPQRNRTLVILSFTADRENVQRVSFIINSFLMPFTSFILIIICTVVLVISLQKSSQWHKTLTSTNSQVSNRNQKVATMVVMISALFISCFVPSSVIMLAVAFVPDLTVGGKYFYSVGSYVCSFMLVMESINSSANIFIYYNMSSKYRDTFKSLMCEYLNRKKLLENRVLIPWYYSLL